MKKPIRVDTTRIQMLDESMFNVACGVCEKLQSKWSILLKTDSKDEPMPVCSLCFLYESEWGRSRAEDLKGYLLEVTNNNPTRKMLLSADNKIASIKDADFILGILVWTSRQWDLSEARVNP
jgi:hypothetical protein